MRKRKRTALMSVGLVLAFGLALAGSSLCSVAASPEETIWGWDSPSGARIDSDLESVELGTAFTVQADGQVTGIRYWRGTTSPAAAPTGTLWTADGERLATAGSSVASGAGWQTVDFASAIKVEAGDSFVASYHAPRGQYAATENYSGSSVSSNLTIPRANAGRYQYSSSTSFPDQTYKSTNYWVTPVFEPETAGRPPVVPVPSPTVPSPTVPSPTVPSPNRPSPTLPPPSPSVPAPVDPGGVKIPGPNTTGVPAGTALRTSSELRVTRANTVLSGLDVNGPVSIEAPGVVIENSRIHGSGGGNGIQVRSGNVTINDSEIYGFENGIGGDDWEAHRVEIRSTTGDGVKLGSGTVLADSWIHDLTPGPGAHSDGIQVQSGITDAVVRHNVVDLANTKSANAAMFVAPDLGPSSRGPLLVERNYFDGGNFTVQVVDGNDGDYFIDQITFRDNTWGRKSNYGPIRTNVPVTWANNSYADNGAVIRP